MVSPLITSANSPLRVLSEVMRNTPVNGYWFDYVLFSFEGRLDRTRYWIWLLSLLGVNLVLQIVDILLGTPFALPFAVLALIPSLALNAKRCHDVGWSAWLLVVLLVPILGALAFCVLVGFRAGDPERNWFGAPGLRLRGATRDEVTDGRHMRFVDFLESHAA